MHWHTPYNTLQYLGAHLGSFLVSDKHRSQLTVHFEEHLTFTVLGQISCCSQSFHAKSFTLLNGNLETEDEEAQNTYYKPEKLNSHKKPRWQLHTFNSVYERIKKKYTIEFRNKKLSKKTEVEGLTYLIVRVT